GGLGERIAGAMAVLTVANAAETASVVQAMIFDVPPPDWLERYPEAVRAVTIEQIRDAFRRRIDPNALVWVRVGGAGDQPNAPSSASNAPPAPDAAATAH
ncbi:MAG TPA: hypothetical protein PKK53_08235, partial [Hydrogenophilus thermoluteolus]|nr:hypothetical protein [Hydrogenophilus thermoluteolus]